MKIYYSETHPVPQEIVNLIQSHALSHELIEDAEISDIYLEEGKNKVTGKAAIEDYLDVLVQEVKRAWYCQCNI